MYQVDQLGCSHNSQMGWSKRKLVYFQFPLFSHSRFPNVVALVAAHCCIRPFFIRWVGSREFKKYYSLFQLSIHTRTSLLFVRVIF